MFIITVCIWIPTLKHCRDATSPNPAAGVLRDYVFKIQQLQFDCVHNVFSFHRLPCQLYNRTYIGETWSGFNTRWKETSSTSTSGDNEPGPVSPLASHTWSSILERANETVGGVTDLAHLTGQWRLHSINRYRRVTHATKWLFWRRRELCQNMSR